MAKQLDLNELYKKLLDSVENTENSEIKKEYINNFFHSLIKDFYNLSEKRILRLNEKDTKIIRTRYGLYNDGNIQTIKQTAKANDVSETLVERSLRLFKQRIHIVTNKMFKDLNRQIRKSKCVLTQEEIAPLEELCLNDTLYKKLRDKLGITTLNQLLNIREQELYKINSIKEYEIEGIKKLLHAIGLKFEFEIKNDADEKIQRETIKEIKDLGLPFVIRKNGNLKYELTMIEELDLEREIIDKFNRRGIVRIKDLTKLNYNGLSRILNSNKEINKVLSELDKLGLGLSNETPSKKIVLTVTENSRIEIYDIFKEIKEAQNYNKTQEQKNKIDQYFNKLLIDFYNIEKPQILNLSESVTTYLRIIYGLYNEYEEQPLQEIANKYGYTITKRQIEDYIYRRVAQAINSDLKEKLYGKVIKSKAKPINEELQRLQQQLDQNKKTKFELENRIELLQMELSEKKKEIDKIITKINELQEQKQK